MENKSIDNQKKSNFIKWAEYKSKIHFTRNTNQILFHAREIWWASLGINIGYEEDGKHYRHERPILIIKKYNKDLALAVPLSSKLKNNLYYYSFIFEDKKISALISQIRIISSKRLVNRVGRLNRSIYKSVIEKIKDSF